MYVCMNVYVCIYFKYLICTVYVWRVLYIFPILSLQKLERMSGAKSVPTDDADKLSVLEYLLSQPHLTMKDVMSTVVDLMTGAVETVRTSNRVLNY